MYKNLAMVCLIGALSASCTGNCSGKPDATKAPRSEKSVVMAKEGEMFLLAGTYTSAEGSKGVYVYRFDTVTGESGQISMAVVSNPSYLVLSPDEKYVYTVGENDKGNSAVHAFAFDKKNGNLTNINSQLTNSAGPCYITIDNRGKNVHTANYGGGSISSFQVKSDGSLTPATSVMLFEGSGPDTKRQESPHLHSVRYSPDGHFLFATDLGTDKLYRFSVSDTPFEGQPSIYESSLTEFAAPAGTGPRHFDFHPDGGRYLYLLGELSGEIIVYDYHFGELQQKQVIASDTVGARGSADIHVSPDGRYLYASNRLQADGVSIFSINSDDGTLEKVGYQSTGKHPRNFVITPNGKFLLVACRDDNVIQVFRINEETGLLTDINKDIYISMPVCLKFATSAE